MSFSARARNPFLPVGELGAGKTCLARGAALGACVDTSVYVSTPTFTLVNEYPGRLPLYHIDLYRLGAGAEEVEALALRDLLSPAAVLLIEWPSRAAGRLPASDLDLLIEYHPAGQEGRLLTLRAGSSAGDKLVERVLAAKCE